MCKFILIFVFYTLWLTNFFSIITATSLGYNLVNERAEGYKKLNRSPLLVAKQEKLIADEYESYKARLKKKKTKRQGTDTIREEQLRFYNQVVIPELKKRTSNLPQVVTQELPNKPKLSPEETDALLRKLRPSRFQRFLNFLKRKISCGKSCEKKGNKDINKILGQRSRKQLDDILKHQECNFGECSEALRREIIPVKSEDELSPSAKFELDKLVFLNGLIKNAAIPFDEVLRTETSVVLKLPKMRHWEVIDTHNPYYMFIGPREIVVTDFMTHVPLAEDYNLQNGPAKKASDFFLFITDPLLIKTVKKVFSTSSKKLLPVEEKEVLRKRHFAVIVDLTFGRVRVKLTLPGNRSEITTVLDVKSLFHLYLDGSDKYSEELMSRESFLSHLNPKLLKLSCPLCKKLESINYAMNTAKELFLMSMEKPIKKFPKVFFDLTTEKGKKIRKILPFKLINNTGYNFEVRGLFGFVYDSEQVYLNLASKIIIGVDKTQIPDLLTLKYEPDFEIPKIFLLSPYLSNHPLVLNCMTEICQLNLDDILDYKKSVTRRFFRFR